MIMLWILWIKFYQNRTSNNYFLQIRRRSPSFQILILFIAGKYLSSKFCCNRRLWIFRWRRGGGRGRRPPFSNFLLIHYWFQYDSVMLQTSTKSDSKWNIWMFRGEIEEEGGLSFRNLFLFTSKECKAFVGGSSSEAVRFFLIRLLFFFINQLLL